LEIYDAETLNFIKPKKLISIQTSDLIYKVFIKNDQTNKVSELIIEHRLNSEDDQ